jgi:uncharacterized protein (UPF0332 family)
MLESKQPQDGITFFRQKMHVTLDAAHCLIDNHFLSDSINRLYYAAMYAAKTLLLTKGIVVKSHQAILKMFGLHFGANDVVERSVSKSLSVLAKVRTKADYALAFTVTGKEILDLQQRAVKFVEVAEQLLQRMDNEKANITSGQG